MSTVVTTAIENCRLAAGRRIEMRGLFALLIKLDWRPFAEFPVRSSLDSGELSNRRRSALKSTFDKCSDLEALI